MGFSFGLRGPTGSRTQGRGIAKLPHGLKLPRIARTWGTFGKQLAGMHSVGEWRAEDGEFRGWGKLTTAEKKLARDAEGGVSPTTDGYREASPRRLPPRRLLRSSVSAQAAVETRHRRVRAFFPQGKHRRCLWRRSAFSRCTLWPGGDSSTLPPLFNRLSHLRRE